MTGTIIWLIGHYGVGKYTVAKEVVAKTGARLFDNHLINNVIFSLIDSDGDPPIPPRGWEMIRVIRQQALAAIEELAPHDFSFVLTNHLQDDPHDRALFAQVELIASVRGNRFVPVVLTCSETAHDTRVSNPDRAKRLKPTDAKWAAEFRRTTPSLPVTHPNRLEVDTTELQPADTAARVLAHIESLRR